MALAVKDNETVSACVEVEAVDTGGEKCNDHGDVLDRDCDVPGDNWVALAGELQGGGEDCSVGVAAGNLGIFDTSENVKNGEKKEGCTDIYLALKRTDSNLSTTKKLPLQNSPPSMCPLSVCIPCLGCLACGYLTQRHTCITSLVCALDLCKVQNRSNSCYPFSTEAPESDIPQSVYNNQLDFSTISFAQFCYYTTCFAHLDEMMSLRK